MNSTTPESPFRRHTLSDVARLAGVSKSAASQVFSGTGRISAQTREAVLRTADEVGFEIDPHAQRLSRGHFEGLIGLLSFGLDMGTGTLKMSLLQRQLIKMGYQISMHAYGFIPLDEVPGEVRLARQACQMRPQALIFNVGHCHESTLQEIRRFIATGGVVVSYDHSVDLDCDQVVLDRAHNTQLALRHMLECGHRRIGLHPGRRHPRDPRFSASRLAAFSEFLNQHEIAPQDAPLFYSDEVYEAAGAEIAEQWLAFSPERRPTGMLVQNDRAASAFVHAVLRAGLQVPGDVSVISDDDLEAARTCMVPLTAVTQPCERIADAVVGLLANRLEGSNEPSGRTVVRGELVTRKSVAAPANLK